MMKVRAKFVVSSVARPYDGQEYVQMHAVYTNDPDSPNYSYSKATPAANLNICITNPDAMGAFEQGKEYLVEFTPA